MRISITILVCLFFAQCYGQKFVEIPENPAITYKNANPDSTKLPLTKEEVNTLCSSLLPHLEKSKSDIFANKLWSAIISPIGFDLKYKTPFWFSGDYPKPVLTLWTKAANEIVFIKSLFIQRFFGGYFGFRKIDTIDNYINNKLRFIEPLDNVDTSIIKPYNEFNSTVKVRLSQVQKEINKKGWTFLFFKKGNYDKDMFTAFVVRTSDLVNVQKLLQKINMSTITWKQLMQ